MVDGKPITYTAAWEKIRQLLHKHAVMVHIDYTAAADPDGSGRPLELWIDASDYGVAGTLTQRPAPHKAPQIAEMVTKCFDSTQLNWSAMEREFYALWYAVTKLERFIH